MNEQIPDRTQGGRDLDGDIRRPATKTIFDYLGTPKAEAEIQKALGTGRDVKRYISGVVTTLAMQPSNSKLLECSPVSILKCCLAAAALGLDLDAKGHAYLVPFGKVATLVPGYKGYIAKARASALINSIWVEAVYSCDTFRIVKGTNPSIEHYPDVSAKEFGLDSAITHVYACAKLRTGETEFEVMTRAQVQAVAAGTAIWKSNWGEMAKKTVWRRFQKKLQLPETAAMEELDSALDARMGAEPVPEAPRPWTKKP